MSDTFDAVFNKVTNHGTQIDANGLFALRREVLRAAKAEKWTSLTDHATEVLERAVALFNSTSGADIPVALVDATADYPEFGVTEITVRLEQGELDSARIGHPASALTFHRFVVRQGLGELFRTPSAPRRLPFVASDDATSDGRTVLDVFNELDVGHNGTFASVRELQAHLNGDLPRGTARLDEDDKAGPMTLDAIRSRIIALTGAAVLPVQIRSLIHSAQILFQDMKATNVEIGGITASGNSVPELFVNPLYDGELRGILRAKAGQVQV